METKKRQLSTRPVHFTLIVVVGMLNMQDLPATAELMAEKTGYPQDEVVDALDELIEVEIIQDEDAEKFFLTHSGKEYFNGIHLGIKSVE